MPSVEYRADIFRRLDRIHDQLHGEALAALGATTREHGAAALGRHTGTEAVALRTLASVRLISALHSSTFHLVFRATVRL